MLAVEGGMWVVLEPFPVLERRPEFKVLRQWLTPTRHHQYFELNHEVREQVGQFMAALQAGKVPIGFCRRPKFPFRADRLLLNIHHAPALIDWLADSLAFQVIFLTRHPAAVTLSVLRNGWGCSAEALQERLDCLHRVLDDDQVEFGLRIIAEGSTWQREILAWVTENYMPINCSKEVSLLITHEELTLNMPAMVRLLCQRFELRNGDRILQKGRGPSGSSDLSSREHRSLLERGEKLALIQNWRNKVDSTQASQAQEILDRYGMAIYNMNSCLPSARYRAFPDQVHALENEQSVSC
jgi:hypothetical protein